MKKILVISYLYKPDNSIGALRPTKMVKKLRDNGFIVDVFCMGGLIASEKPIVEKNGVIFTAATEKKNSSSQNKTSKKEFLSKIVPYFIKKIIWQHNSLKESYKFKNAFKKKYSKLFETKYDYVFTTYGPLGSVLCGLEVKKRNPNIKWICDFRDPICSSLTSFVYKMRFKSIQNRCCKLADYITTVSNGYLNRIAKKKNLYKFSVIPNGFDLDDLSNLNLNQKSVGEPKLKFLYAGSLYNGKRNLKPLFKAVKELIDEKHFPSNSIEFLYAGFDSEIFYQQIKEERLEDLFINLGPISRNDCLRIEQESSVLILSTWNEKHEEGVFPGKFIEYMMMEKPIIALIDGNIGNSEVRMVMEEGNFGVAYEAAYSATDYEILKQYLSYLFDCFERGDSINSNANPTVKNRYNYESLIKKIVALIGD